MPRPRLRRQVWFNPHTTYFKPAGVALRNLKEITLTIEEFEAIRLKDYEELDQEKAAKKMKISQPTFNRVLKTARKKIGEALVHGNAIRIQGGAFKMMQQPGMGRGRGRGQGAGFGGPATSCVCTKCGSKTAKQRGVPCVTQKCPKCGAPMIRGE